MGTDDFGKNVDEIGGPDERFGVAVVLIDEVVDGLFQGFDAAKRPAADAFGDDLAEPVFDQVQPGAGRGDEVHVEPGMPREPSSDPRMLVGRIVVDDQVQIEMGRCLLIDQLEELEPLPVSVTFETPADESALGDFHGREERGGSMSPVVVRHGPAPALPERQAGLSAVQGLHLTLLIDAENQGVLGRTQIESDDVDELLDETRIVAELEGLDAMRLEVVFFPNSLDHRFVDAQVIGERSRAPVRSVHRLGVQRGVDDRSCPSSQLVGLASASATFASDAVDTLFGKANAPPGRDGAIQAEFLGDVLVLRSFSGQ